MSAFIPHHDAFALPGPCNPLMGYSQTAAIAAGLLSVAYTVYSRYSRPSIKDIGGPDNPSWIFGTCPATKLFGCFR